MNIEGLYPILSVSCFLIAIVFFRKDDAHLGKGIVFLIQSMTPHKMKQVFKTQGICLILLGYILFVICFEIKADVRSARKS